MEEKNCPFCAESIKPEAIKCKHCGEILDNQFKQPTQVNLNYQYPQQPKWSGGVAALLSFIIPGAGQMYKGDVGEGIVWFFGVIIGYLFFIIPGLIAHLICIVNASQGNPYE